MDFALSEEQQELAGLAARILEDRMDLQHLKERDRSDDWYDLDTWREFAKANLLGIALPEIGGRSRSRLRRPVHGVARGRAQRRAAPDDPDARQRRAADRPLRHRRAAGDPRRRSSPARSCSPPRSSSTAARPKSPATTATRDGDGWRLDGFKGSVPGASAAELIVVPATVDDGVGAVPRAGRARPASRSSASRSMNHEPLFEVRLDGVRVGDDARLGTPEQGAEILAFTLNRTTVATCALVSGVADKALQLTAQYTTERKQFDRAIGTFQAVGQRMADCYIDNQAIELTMLQAATHLDEGRDDPLEVATAKFWAADGGNHIAHAALHIHGGVSIDVDFPIHRYFLWLKRYEFTLGSATPELLRIGTVLADTPVTQ